MSRKWVRFIGNLWYRPSLDYQGGNVTVNIADSFGQNLKSQLVAAPLVVPKLIYNSFVILIGDSVILTTGMLSADDTSVSALS